MPLPREALFCANARLGTGALLLSIAKTALGSQAPEYERVAALVKGPLPFGKVAWDAQYCWLSAVPEDELAIEEYIQVLADTLTRRSYAESWMFLTSNFVNVVAGGEDVRLLDDLHNQLRATLANADMGEIVKYLQNAQDSMSGVASELGEAIFGETFQTPLPTFRLINDSGPTLTLGHLGNEEVIRVKIPCSWGADAWETWKAQRWAPKSPIVDLLLLDFGYVHEQISHLSLRTYPEHLRHNPYFNDGWLWRIEVEAVLKWYKDVPWWRPWRGDCIDVIERHHRTQDGKRGYLAAAAVSGWWGPRADDGMVLVEIAREMLRCDQAGLCRWSHALERLGDWYNHGRDENLEAFGVRLREEGGWPRLLDWFEDFCRGRNLAL